MKPVQHQPRKLDDDGEQRLKLAMKLTGGNRKLIPFAVITVLDGYKGMEPVTNPALRNHLSHILSRKLRGRISQERFLEKERKKHRATRAKPSLPVMLLSGDGAAGE